MDSRSGAETDGGGQRGKEGARNGKERGESASVMSVILVPLV